MRFVCTQEVSQPQLGDSENDDCAASVQTNAGLYAWVIDGSTSVADQKSHVRATLKDVAWYSHALSQALRAHADESLSPKALHALAAEEVSQAYARAVGATSASIPLYERPSAALTIVRVHEARSELFYLGDCPAFVLHGSGEVNRITDRQRTDGEEDLRTRVKESHARKHLSAGDMFLEQLAWLRAGREQQFSTRPLEVSVALAGIEFGGFERRVDLSHVGAIILMSDGFERYAAQYGLGSFAAMVESTVKDGAQAVLDRIRDFERQDSDARDIPRLKVSDDATCLVLVRVDG